MKRHGNLYQLICSENNLREADIIAQKGKKRQPGVLRHNRCREENLSSLRTMLVEKTFKTSEYTTFKVYEPKERLVFRLPFFPDRICQTAIMRVAEPYFTAHYTSDTYSCIKKRGIHKAANAVKAALKNPIGAKYCLKLDIHKYYPSIDHRILKKLLRRKFKDPDLLWLFDEIIDSAPDGLPIGNLMSQHFANLYLTPFDHWIKEVKKVKHYFRYCDDLVILGDDKAALHLLRLEITEYLLTKLNLVVKDNYQVFPVASRGIDFVGYVSYGEYVRLRKSIKKRFARMIARNPNDKSIASYYGWVKHSDGVHLLKTLLPHEKFQQLRYKTGKQRSRWRKDSNVQSVESGDNGTFVQNSSIPF